VPALELIENQGSFSARTFSYNILLILAYASEFSPRPLAGTTKWSGQGVRADKENTPSFFLTVAKPKNCRVPLNAVSK
jgi:hypothetical protein